MRTFSLLIIAASILLAQTPARKATTPPAKSKAIPATIPKTDDIEPLILRLKAASVKGEFETTEQFQDRQAKAIQFDREYAFAIDYDENDFKYDADAQAMKASIVIESKLLSPVYFRQPAISIKDRMEGEERHVGMNGYGARMVFTSRLRSRFGIVLDRPSSWVTELTFPLTIEQAKIVKSNLRMVVVGTVPNARIYLGSDYQSATISNPLEVSTQEYYLNFLIREVRIVDSRSGQMVARFERLNFEH